ncbi:MAG: hypothetical protein AAF290_02770 [Pseudomonadota bacterium]
MDQTDEELRALKRARRLLRICDIAATKTGRERRVYLQRACFGDPELLAEAESILATVTTSGKFLLDFDLFPSLPPSKE